DSCEALRLLEQAVSLSRKAGMKTSGPRALGALALITDDPVVRRKALSEGETILREGCISHHHFSFYRDAIETCVRNGEWDSAESYGASWEQYTRPEPVPLVDFFVARGRALVAAGRGRRDPATLDMLHRLRQEGVRLGYKLALPAIETALATIAAPAQRISHEQE